MTCYWVDLSLLLMLIQHWQIWFVLTELGLEVGCKFFVKNVKSESANVMDGDGEIEQGDVILKVFTRIQDKEKDCLCFQVCLIEHGLTLLPLTLARLKTTFLWVIGTEFTTTFLTYIGKWCIYKSTITSYLLSCQLQIMDIQLDSKAFTSSSEVLPCYQTSLDVIPSTNVLVCADQRTRHRRFVTSSD